MDNTIDVQPLCPHCGVGIQTGDRFCGSCGKDLFIVQHNALDHHEDAFNILSPTLAYYCVTLLLLATYKLTPLFPEGFEGLVGITIIDTIIVLAFSAFFFRQLKPLFSFESIKLKVVLRTVVCAIIGAIVVSIIADIINVSISDDIFYSIYMFEDTNYPLLFATLFIAVHPAVFEEVAFRGFMFDNLSRLTAPQNVIYITGFVFGIIHLSIISLLWLVPIGIIFAWMRWKYQTLWYGIIGHFVYNFCITLIEFNGWTLS